jgi:hypothetical protein
VVILLGQLTTLGRSGEKPFSPLKGGHPALGSAPSNPSYLSLSENGAAMTAAELRRLRRIGLAIAHASTADDVVNFAGDIARLWLARFASGGYLPPPSSRAVPRETACETLELPENGTAGDTGAKAENPPGVDLKVNTPAVFSARFDPAEAPRPRSPASPIRPMFKIHRGPGSAGRPRRRPDDGAADDQAIARFLAEKGATLCPPPGSEIPGLVWDPMRRKWRRQG